MFHGNRYPLLILAVASLVLAPVVSADDSGLSLEIGAHGHWLDAPAVENWGSFIFKPGGRSFPDSEDDIDSWGTGAQAMIGFGVPMFGEGARLEVGGTWFRNDEHATDSEDFGGLFGGGGGPFGGIHFFFGLPVDGTGGGPLNIAVDSRVNSEFDARIEMWDARLQLAIPVSLGDSLEASGRIGILGGAFDQRFSQTQDVFSRVIGCCPSFNQANSQNDIDSNVDSWFIGPVLGAGIAAELNENIRFLLEAEVALLHFDAEMRVEQTLFSNMGGGTRFDTHETDDENHFSARSRLEGTLELDLGLLLLLSGAFNYWTYAPMVVQPEPAPLFPGSNANSRLSGADMMSAEVGASIVIPF